MTGTVTDELDRLNRGEDASAAADALTAMCDMSRVGVHVTAARLAGNGSRAVVEIDLSNGEVMEFDSVREMCKPAALVAEVVATTGATPKLNGAQAVQAVAFVRAIADWTKTATAADDATSWGLEYLQAATVLDVDMHDQAGRWAAFSHLGSIHPFNRAAEDRTSLAAASVVLRHTDGSRLVRTGWFREYVRTELDHTASAIQIRVRMQTAGWQVRGNAGRVKATCPGRPDSRVWTFYVVPPDWEQHTAGERK
jgi:hypothetical protein